MAFRFAALFAFFLCAAAEAAGPAEERQLQRMCGLGVADAEAFVDQLYGRYHGGGRPVEGRNWPWAPPIWLNQCIFTAPLHAQAMHLRRLWNVYAWPDFAVDPVCQCKDWGDLRVIERNVRAAAPDFAEAEVRFEDGGVERALRVRLERVGSGWRVADLFSADMPDGLVAFYSANLARLGPPPEPATAH